MSVLRGLGCNVFWKCWYYILNVGHLYPRPHKKQMQLRSQRQNLNKLFRNTIINDPLLSLYSLVMLKKNNALRNRNQMRGTQNKKPQQTLILVSTPFLETLKGKIIHAFSIDKLQFELQVWCLYTELLLQLTICLWTWTKCSPLLYLQIMFSITSILIPSFYEIDKSSS